MFDKLHFLGDGKVNDVATGGWLSLTTLVRGLVVLADARDSIALHINAMISPSHIYATFMNSDTIFSVVYFNRR